MLKLITLLLIAKLTAFHCTISGQEKTIEGADKAYDQLDLKKSREILESLLFADTLTDKQTCSVLRRLAYQDWKFFKDYDLAINRLMKADSIGESKFKTWELISRIDRESGRFEQSLNAAVKAKEFAKSNEISLAKTRYAQASYGLLVDCLDRSQPLDTFLLNKTQDILLSLLDSNAGMPEPSKLLMGVSLLKNDGLNVLRAWKSYFHIEDIKYTNSYLLKQAEKLNQICRNWRGNQLTEPEQEMLIKVLASLRLYEFIPVYVRKNHNSLTYNQNTIDIIAYSEYLKTVKELTDEYYRNLAIGNYQQIAIGGFRLISFGKGSGRVYLKSLRNARKELWNKLSISSHRPYTQKNFLRLTEKHFGARGFTAGTSTYSGYQLSLGHMVNQKKVNIEQHGYTTQLLYTEIDMMTSNGYCGWFWEGKAIGGWATDEEIVRVREAYLHLPLRAWSAIHDPTERQKNEEIINDFLTNSNASENKDAEGLAAKLEFDALNDLYEKLYSSGYRGSDLKLAFLSAYQEYRLESFFAHEGRHSIEMKYMPCEFKKWDGETIEFHAKLSEMIFTTEPRWELARMVRLMGDHSAHTKANKRIVQTAIEWIKYNKEEISGFSDNKSAFSQIHLLSVEQIRECYKQADPLYIERSAKL